MTDSPPSLVVLTVPGRVDRAAADNARVERLRVAGRLAAVVRPAARCAWWADDDFAPASSPDGLVWGRRFPLRRRREKLAAEVRRAGGEGAVSAVYAVGAAAWAEGAALAKALDAGLLLGAREEGSVRSARRLVSVLNPTRCLVVAEAAGLAARLREATNNLLVVEEVAPCVDERVPACRRSDPASPLLLAVPLEAGAAGLPALLEGLGRLLEERKGANPGPEVQLLLLGDARALEAGHTAAAAAGRLGCVSQTTGVDAGAEGAGGIPLAEVVGGVDAVARPWVSAAEEPPIGLEAAARGLPVLAAVGEGETVSPTLARRLPGRSPADWAASLAWLLDRPEEAAAAGDAARTRVRERFPVGPADAALLHLAGLVAAQRA